MKKTISLLLAIVMVFSMLPSVAYAVNENAPVISFETTFTEDMTVGDTFTVTANMDSNPGYNSFCFPLSWNEEVVTFKGFTTTYDEDTEETVLDTTALSPFMVVYNDETGIVTGARANNTTKTGMLFTANFEIIGSGDMELGLVIENLADPDRQFQMGNADDTNLSEAAAENIDYSAIENLSVAGGEDEGAAIPEGAPFTAITTDTGVVVAIEQQENVSFNGSDVPYYIVTIPADATTVYVTDPTQVVMEDYTSGEMKATAYGADIASWSTLYVNYDYEEVADGVKVTVPLTMTVEDWSVGTVEMCFVDDGNGSLTHAYGSEDSSFACTFLMSFKYAEEEAEDSFEMITSDGKEVVITYVGDEPNYGMGPLYKVEVPLGTTQVNVIYNEGIVKDNGFGYAVTHMIGFAGVSDDGYGMSTSNGKTTVGLLMQKAPSNMAPEIMKLLNVPYGENPRTVGISKQDGTYDYFAFTYILEEGQHFASLPEGIGYTTSGSPIASDGYTFNVTILDGYETTADFAVKVNGETVSTQPGDITIDSVTEDQIITVEGVQKIVASTDITVTMDMTNYPGTIAEGDIGIYFRTQSNEMQEVYAEAGKSVTLSLNASDNMNFQAYAYVVSPLVMGWEINGVPYYYPSTYTGWTLADDVSMSMNTDGYFDVNINTTNPYVAVIKPIVGTAESIGAAPAFVEDCIAVKDIQILGADVVSSEWDGDTLNVVLAEDTAPDAFVKTIWTIYANNTKEGANQPLFNINGTLQTPSPAEVTFDWAYGMALTAGYATGTVAFEVANVYWSPASQLDFTNKTYTINLTVAEPEPEASGYTVTMPADIQTVAGQTVQVPVTVGNTDSAVTVYNAFDFTFTYDPAVLELTSTTIEGMTVTDNNGTVYVHRYGTDLSVGGTALTLTFKALTAAESEVKLTDAKVGVSETALTQEAADAAILDDTTVITVTGYAVTLPDDFTGGSVAYPDEDYNFEANDKNYDYTVEATIDGEKIDVTDNGDGTFTIPADQITGNIVITSTKEGKTFDVTVGEDMTGESKAQYMTDYTATLTKEPGFGYKITVTVGGNEYTGFTYDDATGTLTIPGKDITGEIVINSGKEAGEFTVTFEGNGAGDAQGEAVAEGGKAYSFTVTKAEGYEYTVTATMGGTEVQLTEADGTYTIANVTGNIVVTIEKTADLAVEVTEYVTLDGKTMFLVTATQTLDEGKALSYDGNVMFWSNQYNAWAYLVITEGTLSAEDAKAVITDVQATYTALDQTYDVNEAGKVDINDAQLVFDMYNNEYQDFSVATMVKFLKADVNNTKNIDVNDAAAIVAQIIANK